MSRLASALLLAAVPLAGCGGDVSTPFADDDRYDPAVIERERTEASWRRSAERDRAARGGAPDGASQNAGDPEGDGAVLQPAAARDEPETLAHITAAAVNAPPRLPLRGGSGPSVLRIQILLDRVSFSPGILDGYWGKNTEKAVYWFQHAHGLEPTGRVDDATYARLRELAEDGEPVMLYGLSADDLRGPFVSIPRDIYAQAGLRCLCYESPLELVSERFHSTPELVAQLNPGVDLGRLEEGRTLWVPNADEAPPPAGRVARIVVSRRGFYTHALDAVGRILFHFPSTLGSRYDPSPDGRTRVVGIVRNPHFHYQPKLFSEVPDHMPEAMLQPGPNSPVGVVWIALSKRHYGIHGTREPRSIGYTSSHGCVRLTNWDARLLARHAAKRTPVEFR
ncbi:MAG: murein L,D-transpeptidase [Gemmatimonadetes bacterium]|nr:murein L,D-transpeptidase [Gemmatimonadota bacterium]